MDPDKALEDLRNIVARHDSDDGIEDGDIARFVELFDSLDIWISERNGFLPKDWRNND